MASMVTPSISIAMMAAPIMMAMMAASVVTASIPIIDRLGVNRARHINDVTGIIITMRPVVPAATFI